MTISEPLKEIGGTVTEGPTKTEDPERTIVLPSVIRYELVEHLARFSDPTDPDAIIFQNEAGGDMRASNFRNRAFYPACRRAGIEPVHHVHDLRHSAATLMFSTGASPREVQDALGHSDPRLTLAIYAGVLSEMQERTADRMDEMIAEVDAGEAKVISLPR